MGIEMTALTRHRNCMARMGSFGGWGKLVDLIRPGSLRTAAAHLQAQMQCDAMLTRDEKAYGTYHHAADASSLYFFAGYHHKSYERVVTFSGERKYHYAPFANCEYGRHTLRSVLYEAEF